MVVIKITVMLSLIWVLFYIILRNKLKDSMHTLGLLLGDDGKISVYRVKDIIRVDINKEETKC